MKEWGIHRYLISIAKWGGYETCFDVQWLCAPRCAEQFFEWRAILMSARPISREELMAFAELSKARRQLVVNMFTGTKLVFGRSGQLSTAKSLLSTGKSMKSSVGKLAKGGSAATKVATLPGMKEAFENFMVECADVDNIHDVIAAIGGEVLHDLIAEVTPYLGVVTSSVKLAKAGKAVAQDGHNLYKSTYYKEGFRKGDPYAGAEAVQMIIKRDLAQHSVKLAQQTVATGAKIGGLFADLGTVTTAAIGVANTLASLGLQLFSLGLDIKDMRAGNRRLAEPNALDLSVFAECPVLGCYLISCADTSSVADILIADIGLPGWMDRVEEMKKKQIEPLIKIASKNIASSRLQLEGLASNKGTHVKKGFFASVKSKALKQLHLA
ncbi:hypothetical protein PY254_14800 [Rhodanobacter sp. AS-Z3]|uniref:hypothetical protein n=1 Tax=Rhodanobacter sp. AS-Z3 TaxID=3031330 RepID=UPI0024791CD2|nr:hypothetical protein [Rhodanobacter sp. AS-Z3]WEN14484.1 hypothetical protein PY254_14800 [Rhodanobacter sp. AS-Z3]